jgi:hypothetical protein
MLFLAAYVILKRRSPEKPWVCAREAAKQAMIDFLFGLNLPFLSFLFLFVLLMLS